MGNNVPNVQLVQALRQDLHAGEAEAIALALETQADLLLMDERIGRESDRSYLNIQLDMRDIQGNI